MPDPFNPLLILETERLILRRQTAADIEALVALWSSPEVTRCMGGPREEGFLRQAFAETAADPFAEVYDLWPAEEKSSGRIVGHCGLLEKEIDGISEIELNYIFAPEAWGKGYATEMAQALAVYAFGRLGLARLVAIIHPENHASERVAVKIGMRLEKETIRPGGAVKRIYGMAAPSAGHAGGQ